MSDRQKPQAGKAESGKVEGEGSYTATRTYNEATETFVKSGKVEQAAKDAAQAVQGPQKAELEKAEAEGKRRSHGEDPQLTKK